MGARLLRRWLGQPLLDLEALERRLASVQLFVDDAFLRGAVSATLSRISDLERISSRLNTGNVHPRELLALKEGIEASAETAQRLTGIDYAGQYLSQQLVPLPDVAALIAHAVAAEPTGNPGEGGVFNPGFSDDLDRLKAIPAGSSPAWSSRKKNAPASAT